MKTTGIILIIIGVALTLVTSFKFFTKEKVIDIGNVEITRDKPNKLSWSPVIGFVFIGIGGIVFWQASKK